MAVVRQPEKLLDDISVDEFARDERLPYWAELWTSSIVMGEHILQDPSFRGAALLELGCGVGLAGIAAARAGAQVTMTDYDDDALLFAATFVSNMIGDFVIHRFKNKLEGKR